MSKRLLSDIIEESNPSAEQGQGEVNPNYCYTDGNIDCYVKTVIRHGLGGFKKVEGEENTESSFLLKDQFGTGNGAYYVAYSGAIDSAGAATSLDYFLDKTKQPAPEAGRPDHRKDVFDELMQVPVMLGEENCKAKILFPYNITQSHWLTGEITLEKRDNDVSVKVYTHDPYGGGKLSEEKFTVIEQALKKGIEAAGLAFKGVTNLESKFAPPRQQKNDGWGNGDGTSCGVIVADEIIKRVQDGSLDLPEPHEIGAVTLRASQLEYLKKKLGQDSEEFKKFKGDISTNAHKKFKVDISANAQDNNSTHNVGQAREAPFQAVLHEADILTNGLKAPQEAKEDNAHQAVLVTENQPDLRFNISQPFTPDGLKRTLHGNVYQLGLLTLAAIRAQAKGLKFYLISEAQEFEKFDDLVIDYGDKITYLQAKHSSLESATYSIKDFCGDYENDASLAKYFDSWYRLRNSEYSKPKGQDKTTQYIFFTNKEVLKASAFLVERKIDSDEFLFQNLGTNTYGIKSDKESRSELIDAILASSKEVQSNSDGNSSVQIDFGLLKNEIENVKKYLVKKIKEQNNKIPSEIKLDGRSNLSKKELALIKLAKEEESVAEKVLGKESEVIKWLQQHKQIVVNISNPLGVLAPKMTLEINDFLDVFIIKIEQPNSHDLTQIILKELGADIATIGTKELGSALYSYMWEWFANCSECLLKSEDFIKFVKVTEGDLYRFYLLEGTRSYKEECESHIVKPIHFALVSGLRDFLTRKNNEGSHSIAVFKDKGGGAKLQIYGIITTIDSLKDDEWSFLHLSNKNMNLLPQILIGESAKFYIIDCRSEEIDESHFSQLQKICQTTIENQKKLILLIGAEQEKLADRLVLRENSSKFVEFESQPLADEQIRLICTSYSNQYVSLAGKEYRIQDIINNKLGSTYQLMSDAEYLVQLIESSHKEMRKVESEMPYGVYVSNQMCKGEGYYDLSIITKKTADCYIVAGADYIQLRKKLSELFEGKSAQRLSIGHENIKEETEFVLLKNANELDNVNDLDKRESRIIIILTEKPTPKVLEDRTYISLKTLDNWQFQIAENPNNLYLPFPEGIEFSNKDVQEQFIHTIISGNQLSVLMSPAGYGKTSFCKNVVEKYKSSDSNFAAVWIIKIPLPKLQFDEKSCPILTPFIDMDYEWQRVAWENDTKVSGSVFIILDGFDEIKNIETVKLINQWISTIPGTISLLITTRESAANKLVLPTDRNSTFYKLTVYTEEQRKEYIKRYIKAILKCTQETKEFSVFVNHITEKIKSKVNSHSSEVLGIPLESYIFCELLKPHILIHVIQHSYSLQEDSMDILEDIDVSNVAKLYQEFILSKSGLFLEKHLGINPDNIVKKSILFNIMGSYNQIIELYALMQAFNLNEKHEIEKYVSSINFDINELKTLEDTGLLRVSKDGRRLNFNHETYQEFYAALAIIRGILSDKGELHEIVKSLVREHRYDTKFYFIFSIASQFSISAGAMVPGYSIEKHLLPFWNLLGDDGDVLGTGAINLFKRCVSGCTLGERAIILSKTEGKKWAKFLKVAISRCEDGYKKLQTYDEQDSLPISFQQDAEDTDEDVHEEINTSKDVVAEAFRRLRKKEALDQEKVKLLETAAKQHEMDGDYWALDGGIDAIGCTGRFFSKNLAVYLILRASQWENNKKLVVQALISICRDLEVSKDYNNARVNCFFVTKSLLENEVYENTKDLFSKLRYVVVTEFLDYLIDDLLQLLSTGIKRDEVDLFNPASIFKSSFEIMQIILLVAEKLEYGILINESKNQITLVKDTKIEIQFGESVFSQMFANLMLKLLRSKFDSNADESCTSAISLKDIDKTCLQEIKEFIAVQLRNEELFDKLFDSHKDEGQDLLYLYKESFEHKSITKHSIDKYIAELTTSKATEPYKKWSISGGIEIAGYTGIYFNEKIAEFLQLRAGFWNDNWHKAVSALKCICDILTTASDIEKLQEHYTIAVNAYNQCIVYYGLESITTGGKSTPPKNSGGLYQLSKIPIEYWLDYNEESLTRLLKLRIASLVGETRTNDFIRILETSTINSEQYLSSQSQLMIMTKQIQDIYTIEENISTILIPILLPKNAFISHWVGIALVKKDNEITVTYLDSENQPFTKTVQKRFIIQLQLLFPEYIITFGQPVLEQQRYNNCGPELVENFVCHITGSRAEQEDAPYLHSALWEQKIILDIINQAAEIEGALLCLPAEYKATSTKEEKQTENIDVAVKIPEKEKEVVRQKYYYDGLKVPKKPMATVAKKVERIDEKEVPSADSMQKHTIVETVAREQKVVNSRTTDDRQESSKNSEISRVERNEKEIKMKSTLQKVSTAPDLMQTNTKQQAAEVLMEEIWQQAEEKSYVKSAAMTPQKKTMNVPLANAEHIVLDMLMGGTWEEADKERLPAPRNTKLEGVRLEEQEAETMNAVWEQTKSQFQAKDNVTTRSIPTVSTKEDEGKNESTREHLKKAAIENEQMDPRYEAEKILMEERMRAEQQEAAVPQSQQYSIRIPTISPNEIASSLNFLIKMLSGESPCGGIPTDNGLPSNTLELLQGVRLYEADSGLAARTGGRGTRDLRKALENELKALTAALPNKPVSPELPSSSLLEGMKLMGAGSQEPWAQQFKEEVDLSGIGE